LSRYYRLTPHPQPLSWKGEGGRKRSKATVISDSPLRPGEGLGVRLILPGGCYWPRLAQSVLSLTLGSTFQTPSDRLPVCGGRTLAERRTVSGRVPDAP
jgi:hypothetical protein